MEFGALPTEIKLHICSFLEPPSITAILSIQAVSKEFRDLLWRSRTHLVLEEWESKIDPLALLNRCDPSIITHLDISGLDQNHKQYLPSPIDIISNYSALEWLGLDELPVTSDDLSRLENAIISHKSLLEISGSLEPVPMELYRNIAKRVRLVVLQKGTSDSLDLPTVNFCDEYIAIFKQEKSISVPNKTRLVKGISADWKLVVGSSDGTIFLFKYSFTTDRYELAQTFHEHTSEITCMYYLPATEDLVIASMDGKVTRWKYGSKIYMELLNTKQLPEPIYHIYCRGQLLIAASKHKTYFYVDDKLKKQGFKSEHVITDLAGSCTKTFSTGLNFDNTSQDLYIATQSDINRIPGHAILFSENLTVQTSPHGFSNLTLSDSQLIMEVTPTELVFKPFLFQKAALVIEGKFDASNPHLSAFQPFENIVVCSNGPCLLAYDLLSARQIACVSPQISKADLLQGNYPTCTALWFSREGHLYAIYTDNKIYWWNVISTREMDFMPVSDASGSYVSDNEEMQESFSDNDDI